MTMNATAPAVTPATPAAPSAPERPSVHDRASSLKAKLDALPEPTVESSAPSPATDQTSSTVDSGGQAKPPPPAATDARAERLKRIEQVRAKERADEQERAQRKQGKERETEVEKLRARVAELEPMNKVFSSEEALLEEAEKRNLSAEKLVQWMRTKLTDPNAVAQRQVKTEADKLREEMKALQDRLDKTEQDRVTERQRVEAERAQETKTTTFLTQVKERAGTYPLTAALHAKYKDEGLIGFANQFIAPLLSPDYSLDELYDHTEQLLEEMQVAPAQAAVTAPPASGPSHPPQKNGAAKPVTTLSNDVASERVSVTEEVPLHRMSRAERIARAKKQAESE